MSKRKRSKKKRFNRPVGQYVDFGTFDPEEVLPHAVDPRVVSKMNAQRQGIPKEKKRRKYLGKDGNSYFVKMTSQRYWVFRKNPSCVVCGRTGSIMVLQRDRGLKQGAHFNFYSVEEDGTRVLMTKDHIEPIAEGGKDVISNYQTMCSKCNGLKGNKRLTPDQLKEMLMSEHRVDIIEVGEILPHPNPEVTKMKLTHVLGWQCCIGKGQFSEGDKAVYIEPDFCVPTSHPSFAFLAREDGKPKERIRVRRFKGTLSQGLLISVPEELADLPVGENVIEQLDIERYVPPIEEAGENFIDGPSGLYCCKFDVENWQRWDTMFKDGETVHVTEKLHGTSSRYTYAKTFNADTHEWVQFCGTRINWMKAGDNPYWRAFNQCPGIEDWCREHPEQILYGEVFGMVKGFRYGAEKNTEIGNPIFFAAFGVLNKNTWLPFDEARASVAEYGVPWVPLLYSGSFDIEKIKELAEGDSSWLGAEHMREGVVVLPQEERTDPELGRVQLKIVSNRYLGKRK